MNVYICHITSASLGPASTRFFQLNLKCQWTHPIPWEIILIYWLYRRIVQPFLRWGNTQRRRDPTILSLFARNPGKSVDKITAGHLFQNKNKRPRWQWAFKFAALPRKRRKRLYDVENFAYKLVRIVLMWRPAFGSQVTSRNRDSFSKEKREPWERGCFARLADRWICQVFKRSILFYCSDTTRSFRPVPLWLRKPFLAELVILLIRCIQKHEFNIRVLLLIASQFRDYFFRIPYFTSYLYWC